MTTTSDPSKVGSSPFSDIKILDRVRQQPFQAPSLTDTRLHGWYRTKGKDNPILHCGDWRAIVYYKPKARRWAFMICHADEPPIWNDGSFADTQHAMEVAEHALIDYAGT